MKYLIFCVCILGAASSFAGGETGGGNAQVCFVDSKVPDKLRQSLHNGGGGWIDTKDITPQTVASVKMFDYLDALTPIGEPGQQATPKVIQAIAGEWPMDYVERIKLRFKNLLPSLVNEIQIGQNALSKFKSYSEGLGPINDVGQGANYESANCVRVTIIGQYELAGSEFIAYDSRFYNLPKRIFSDTNRGISFLHEFAYYNPRIRAHQINAENSRALVAAAITQDVKLYDVLVPLRSTQNCNDSQYCNYSYKDDETYIQTLYRKVGDRLNKSKLVLSGDCKNKSECESAAMNSGRIVAQWYTQVASPVILSSLDVSENILRLVDSDIRARKASDYVLYNDNYEWWALKGYDYVTPREDARYLNFPVP